ncbi:methyltransferase domain-containing protein [Actinomadura barringtoniae]|uniref:Methyltransferase domain-containing protein n=1 Tax=Actinomadura barringtoniae TaxID=1427535 RepID=A0A939PPN2_9ACTN|nr:methyltransferase domain-containing protein [Actinomadura barringtoniae]
MEECYDPVSTARLEALGVGPGWRCLEVGGGGGSIGRWLAERAGPEGRVLITDLDPRWVRTGDAEVIVHDLRTDPLPENEFDLVHARLVLIHLPERLAALDKLVRSLRPGGVLALDEFDLPLVQVLKAPDEAAAALFTKVHDAMIRAVQGRGADPMWGSHAYGALVDAGLGDVRSLTYAESWTGGSPGTDLHRVNVEQVRAQMDQVDDAELAAFWDLLRDPGFAVASYPLITTWGRRA